MADRGDPIDLAGDGLDGEPVDVADLRGKVVVVNVWWSLCGPCRLEAPILVAAAGETTDEAAFVGVNTRDSSPDSGLAFDKRFGVTYPSIYDPSGKALLAFAGRLNPRTIPSTLLLDKEGRVAGVFSGNITSKLTLTEVVQDLAAEK